MSRSTVFLKCDNAAFMFFPSLGFQNLVAIFLLSCYFCDTLLMPIKKNKCQKTIYKHATTNMKINFSVLGWKSLGILTIFELQKSNTFLHLSKQFWTFKKQFLSFWNAHYELKNTQLGDIEIKIFLSFRSFNFMVKTYYFKIWSLNF